MDFSTTAIPKEPKRYPSKAQALKVEINLGQLKFN
jgi:hypothetical protein